MWNCPLSYHENSTEKFGFIRKTGKDHHHRAAKFMPSVVLGPTPVRDFLTEFRHRSALPVDDMPSPNGAFDEVPLKSDKESAIYHPMVGFYPFAYCPRYLTVH